MSPYNPQRYVAESEEAQVEDYALLAHSGHGVNSDAIHYYLVQDKLRMFLQLLWGGAYMDARQSAAKIRERFSMADRLVAATQTVGKFQPGGRLTMVVSDFYGGLLAASGTKAPPRLQMLPVSLRFLDLPAGLVSIPADQ